MKTRRLVRALDLVADEALIAQYIRFHAPESVWPEVIDHIRASGVLTMEIWATGDRLVMVMEVEDDYPRDVPEPERVAEWEVLMEAFQRRLPDTPPGRKWTDMQRVFALDAADPQ